MIAPPSVSTFNSFWSRMGQSLAVVMSASFLVAAALLWLSVETVAAAAGRPAGLARALVGGAVVFGACGLWWPAHALGVHGTASVAGADPMLAWVPTLLLAWMACLVGALMRRRVWFWAVALSVTMPVLVYVYAMFSAPGVFRLSAAPAWLGAGTLTVGLSAALVAAHGTPASGRWLSRWRAAFAALAAAIACLGAVASMPATSVARFGGSDWPIMLAFLALGVLLRFVLTQTAGGTAAVPARRSRSASLDQLTGLPTRLHFEARLHSAAKKCDAGNGKLAVLFVDLDGFKPVNDSFNHRSGDRVLEQVGLRLQALAKGGEVAARVGGDEFLLLTSQAASREVASQLANKVIEVLRRPYKVDSREISISCSVGIALYPDSCQANKLIARADAAMYAAKKAGGSRLCFYTPGMDADLQHNFDMLSELRQALANDELELYFQPKIDVRSGKVTAAEALIRWQHPTRGLVMPDAFLPLAERSGLIGPLGDWVIEAACKQARAWRDKGLRMRVAINLSAHQMRQDDIVDRIAHALEAHRIHPSLLTCEITESAAMEDTVATQETFRRLGELGTHLSIDDFGTGYSSLSYLRQLPAQELKIDQSFVKDVDVSADARAIVDAVVKLAHALGLKVVAEGVETLRQQKALVALGCDELQGYLFAKPMTARALLMWAIDDRSVSAVFRPSLFGETRQIMRDTTRQMISRSP
ncbi:MAG: EAL domain-containing protein [Burkholderiales bacterium]